MAYDPWLPDDSNAYTTSFIPQGLEDAKSKVAIGSLLDKSELKLTLFGTESGSCKFLARSRILCGDVVRIVSQQRTCFAKRESLLMNSVKSIPISMNRLYTFLLMIRGYSKAMIGSFTIKEAEAMGVQEALS
ncbi:conserved hypothetical protein [Ricinus communis]|uniref:Uncharacterized protein n=1 Tax=Ricinus communis TaxID=3988 RepID=B9SXU7_RICCO|nr:conserved hypothetical protein [Ricinus communis]